MSAMRLVGTFRVAGHEACKIGIGEARQHLRSQALAYHPRPACQVWLDLDSLRLASDVRWSLVHLSPVRSLCLSLSRSLAPIRRWNGGLDTRS